MASSCYWGDATTAATCGHLVTPGSTDHKEHVTTVHKQSVLPSGLFPCWWNGQLCATLRTKNEWTNHVTRAHFPLLVAANAPKTFPCGRCGHSFGARSTTKSHEVLCELSHPDGRVFVLNGERFQGHGAGMRWQCPVCTKWLSPDAANRRKHLATHRPSPVPKQCYRCGKDLSRRADNSRRHERDCKGVPGQQQLLGGEAAMIAPVGPVPPVTLFAPWAANKAAFENPIGEYVLFDGDAAFDSAEYAWGDPALAAPLAANHTAPADYTAEEAALPTDGAAYNAAPDNFPGEPAALDAATPPGYVRATDIIDDDDAGSDLNLAETSADFDKLFPDFGLAPVAAYNTATNPPARKPAMLPSPPDDEPGFLDNLFTQEDAMEGVKFDQVSFEEFVREQEMLGLLPEY